MQHTYIHNMYFICKQKANANRLFNNVMHNIFLYSVEEKQQIINEVSTRIYCVLLRIVNN